MSNMSYCRFQNTDRDLRDCQDALEGILLSDEEFRLSPEELFAAKQLVERCLDIARTVADAAGVEIDDLDDRRIADAIDDANDEIDSEGEPS